MVIRILDRFRSLSLIPQVDADAQIYKWPISARSAGDPRAVMSYPHRLWAIPQPEGKRARQLSPVEFIFIPLIIQKYENRRDGDVLEIIQQCRELVTVTFPNEIKDNPKVWRAMTTFLSTYDPSTQLKGIYKDDGSLAGSGAPRVHNASGLVHTPSSKSVTPTASDDSRAQVEAPAALPASSDTSPAGRFHHGSRGTGVVLETRKGATLAIDVT
ncbi:hypothetical protein JCM11491_001764 [Sporobolomyces phaffii]